MASDKNSYGSIIKATSLFGGTKVFQIIISIVRSKVVAVLLGPSGIGILGLFNSTTGVIGSLIGFGLETTGVRDVAQAYSSKDEDRKDKIISVVRKLVFITGMLGTLLTFVLSNHLSKAVFGTNEYALSFKIISIVLLVNQLNIGQIILMQGTFHYKEIAKSTLLGSLIGLFFTLPFYFFMGIDGIVPAIVLSSLLQLILSWYFSKKIQYRRASLDLRQIISEGKVMLTLGFVIAVTGFATQGKDYAIRIFVSHLGGLNDVGLFTAGISLTTTYVGLILNAMSSDYSPRLSAVANNDVELIQVINKQSNLLITMISPLVILFIVYIKLIIIFLYSNKFIEITGMIEIIMLGMLFRALSWAISFSFIGRGESKIFFWNEMFANIYSFLFSVFGYLLFGLEGLGIGFLLTYIFYTLQMYFLAKKQFSFHFNSTILKTLIIQIVLCGLCFFILQVHTEILYRYIIGTGFFLLSLLVSLLEINKMIGIKTILHRLKKMNVH